MLEVQSLPTVLPESFDTSDKIQEIRSAYSMTLLLEHAASSNIDPKIRERKLIHARVLGHLLREAPSMYATENVANQVNSCQNNDQLDALGEMYFLHYICAYTESSPPSPQTRPVRQSFETKRGLVEYMLRTNGDPSQCSEGAQKRALVRDDFRCMITGMYDYRSLEWSTEIMQEVTDSDVSVTLTECLYIFPQSIARISGVDAKDAKHEYATSIWTIMSYFGFEDLPDKLAGNGIHTLENVMTLDASYPKHNGMARRDNPITLTSQHADLPLPNRTFLAIHAACCRIANLSGARIYIEEILDNMEEMGVLA
ncbi:hypothetical protein BGY98DRAFT_911855 [Russula aff. rugulosa BPL654]|nr:hypothetical protein BGY98DRAFT_911855 [Russula aff. rugulosa BPL654]